MCKASFGWLSTGGGAYLCDIGDTDRVLEDMRRWWVMRDARSPFPSTRSAAGEEPVCIGTSG